MADFQLQTIANNAQIPPSIANQFQIITVFRRQDCPTNSLQSDTLQVKIPAFCILKYFAN